MSFPSHLSPRYSGARYVESVLNFDQLSEETGSQYFSPESNVKSVSPPLVPGPKG